MVREFTTRTHFHILNDPSEAADATLRGTVLSASSSPLTYNSATGQAASVLVVVSMKVSLTDRQGKVLYQNPSYLFREQYEISQDLTSFFEEDSPAFRRLSQISRIPWSLTSWRTSSARVWWRALCSRWQNF